MRKDNSIFRKTSVDRINSPEQLNQYIRVTNVSIWIVLAAIFLLLAGFIIWGFFGTISTTVDTVAVTDDGKTYCYISPGAREHVKVGMVAKLEDDGEGVISEISKTPVKITDEVDDYVMFLGDFTKGEFYYIAQIDVDDVPDGIYETTIVIDTIHPIKFIID